MALLKTMGLGWMSATPQWTDRESLAACSIVRFDYPARTPRQRAAMLRRLGLGKIVWDWSLQNVPFFEDELDAYHEEGIDVIGIEYNFPLPSSVTELGKIDPNIHNFVWELNRRGLTPDIWVTVEVGSEVSPSPLLMDQQNKKIELICRHLTPLLELAQENGMCVLLANHLGWAGDPRNLAAVVRSLETQGFKNVGLAYQLQHAHAHLNNFEEIFHSIKEQLIAVTLSGLTANAIQVGNKIIPFGQGEADEKVTQIIFDSGWEGQLCILGYSKDDAEKRLADSLAGFTWISRRLKGAVPPKPVPQIPYPNYGDGKAEAFPKTAAVSNNPYATNPETTKAKKNMSIPVENVSQQAPNAVAASTHALLKHLEKIGFKGAPRSYGWDKEGRHLVEYLPGIRADHPKAPDIALTPQRVGAFLRELHDALATFTPPAGAEWFTGIEPDSVEMIVHQDVVPSNLVIKEDGSLAAIDWDAAGPGNRLWDMAHTVHAFAPLNRNLDIRECAAGLARFVNAYGLDNEDRTKLIPLLALRSERMYEYLNKMRLTGTSPWVELWDRGVGTVWKADAQWLQDNTDTWWDALLS